MYKVGNCYLCKEAVIDPSWYVKTPSGLLIHGECVLAYKAEKDRKQAEQEAKAVEGPFWTRNGERVM